MSEDNDDNNDVFYMTDRRRIYIEPYTGEMLFLEWSTHDDGWMPAKSTMTAWQEGRLRIYNPTDAAQQMMITMPGAQRWPFLGDTEEEDVRGVMARPWIPDGQAFEGVREQDIVPMDRTYEILTLADSDIATSSSSSTAGATVDESEIELYETHRIPTLLIPMTYDLIRVMRPPPPPPQRPPPPLPDAVAPKPFPRHLVAAVLANATAERKICPITMEPITPETATVTSCGHVFQTEAIKHWLRLEDGGNAICPECREPTCI